MKKHLNFWTFLVIMVLAFLGLILIYSSHLLSQEEFVIAALTIITIVLLATTIIPEYITVLLFFLAAMVFKLAPAKIIFSGFSSTAFWLILGGLILGVAITETGLGERVAGKMAGHLEGSYIKLVTGLTFLGLALDFIMPSAMGRIALIIPIVIGISDFFGFERGSNGRMGLILASTLGTYIPAFAILPSNVPNMILAGLAESQFKVSFLYGDYFLLHFPVMGLLKAILIIIVIIKVYPDSPNLSEGLKTKQTGRISRNERILIYTIIIMLVLWATDFIHHISPAWIALAGAVFLMFPGVNIVSDNSFSKKINYGSLFFIAGLVGLGSIINYSGLGDSIGKVLISILPLDRATPFINYISITTASTLTGLISTLPGVPAVMTPLSPELARISGFSLSSILMQQVAGFSTTILPYEAPPLVIAMYMANEKVSRILKPLFLVTIITIVVLIPVDFLWWKFLGWL